MALNFSRFALMFLLMAVWGLASPLWAQQVSDTFDPEAQIGLAKGANEPVRGEKWLISTANPHASEAGANVLRAGGNAIDAMVAIQTTLGLTEPQSSGLGGGGFLVYWDNKEKRLTTFDGRETAPFAITPQVFLNGNGRPLQFLDASVSGRSVGTPGMPKLLHETHKKLGSLPWNTLMDHAISLADEGFAISPRLAGLIENREDTLRRFETTKAYFFDQDGKRKRTGAVLKNKAYGDTLRAFRDQGADAIYKGPIAEMIVDRVQSAVGRQGLLSLEDLAAYEIKEREPVCYGYHDHNVCGMGPPSSGSIAVAQVLGLLEPFNLRERGPNDPITWQLFGDATRLSFADRGRYVADPEFLPVPVRGLLDPNYLKTRSGILKAGKKLDVALPGQPAFDHAFNYGDGQSLELPSTTHFVIHDAEGNIVSMTSSIESAFGSHLMVAGFLLNNQMTDFSFRTHADGRPVANAAAPGKRPRSSMSPTLIMKDGKPVMAIGSPGGSRIITYVAQSIIALIDWGMNIQEAINMPHMTNRFGVYALEANTRAVEFQPALEKMGYETVVIPLNSGLHGFVIKDGVIEGGADPRREGIVIAE